MDQQQLDQLLAALGAINDNLDCVLGCLGFGFGTIFFIFIVWLCFIWRGR